MTSMILIVNSVICLLLIGLAIPALLNQVGPNRAYGVRLPKSLASPENWYRINRYGAKQLIGWSSTALLALVTGFFLRIEEGSTLFWVCLMLPASSALVAALLTLRFSRKI